MRKHPMMLLVFVSGLFLGLTGCPTAPEPETIELLPALPEPALENLLPPEGPISEEMDAYLRSLDRDYVTLVGLDLRWRLQQAANDLIVGSLTPAEYAELVANLQNRLQELPDG